MKGSNNLVPVEIACRVLHLEPRHVYNLLKMAVWLWDNRENLKGKFDIKNFATYQNMAINVQLAAKLLYRECGSTCCVIGHSINPDVGLIKDPSYPSRRFADWSEVSHDFYGMDVPTLMAEGNMAWRFMFASNHVNDPGAAAKRIVYMVMNAKKAMKRLAAAKIGPSQLEVHLSDFRVQGRDAWHRAVSNGLEDKRKYLMDPANMWTMNAKSCRAMLSKLEKQLTL